MGSNHLNPESSRRRRPRPRRRVLKGSLKRSPPSPVPTQAAFLLTQTLSLQLTFLMDGEEDNEGHDDDEEQGHDCDEADFQGGPAGLLTQFGMSGLGHSGLLCFSLML